jgi:uncharacterized protein involved in outer membrane biogenesis
LPELDLSEPTVRLERSERGQLNWAALNFSDTTAQKPERGERQADNLPTLGHLRLRDARFVYHDYATREEVTSSVAELTATTTGEEQTLDVKGSGQFADKPLQLTLHTDSLADWETGTSVVQGPLRHPSVSTNVGEALLSLATPVETAVAEPADCQGLVEQTRQETSSSKP